MTFTSLHGKAKSRSKRPRRSWSHSPHTRTPRTPPPPRSRRPPPFGARALSGWPPSRHRGLHACYSPGLDPRVRGVVVAVLQSSREQVMDSSLVHRHVLRSHTVRNCMGTVYTPCDGLGVAGKCWKASVDISSSFSFSNSFLVMYFVPRPH